MDYDKLIETIKKRLYDYNDGLNQEKEFFINFLEKYPDTSIETILAYEPGELLMAFLNYKQLKRNSDIYGCTLLNKIGNYSIINTLNKMIDGSFNENDMRIEIGSPDLSTKEKELVSIETIRIFRKINSMKISSLFVLIFSLQAEFNDVMNEKYDSLSGSNKMNKINPFIKEIKEQINDNIQMKDVQKELKPLYEYANSIVGHLSLVFIKKANKSYTRLINILEQERKNKEITNIDQIIKYAVEDDIKELCLEYIYNHNMKYYKKLEEEYEEKSKHSINAYIAYFCKYGINFQQLDEKMQKKIMEESIDEINIKMSFISEYTLKEDYIEVLINTTYDNLEEIKRYINKDILTDDFIKENVEILIDKDKYDNLIDNIELLSERINIKKYDDKSFLMTDNNIIRENINLLSKSNIPFNTCRDLSMLKNGLKQKLELFIEVGLEDDIKNNPDILNKDINLAKQVIIEKMVTKDKFDITNLIISDSFYVKDNELDRFIFNRDNSNYLNKNKIYIPSDNETDLSYIYKGIIIPKLRVKTQPVTIEDIIKPSLYNKEEVKKLEKLL